MKNIVKLKKVCKNLLWIVLVFFTFLGCRKNDVLNTDKSENYEALQKQFFNTAAVSDTEIKKLAENIRKQDSIFKFLPEFARKNGIPKWNKVIYKTKYATAESGRQATFSSKSNNQSTLDSSQNSNNQNQGVFFIPLQSQNSSTVQSYITAYKHNDSLYTYRVYNKDSLNALQPGSSTTKNNLLNTQAVFGYFEKSINNKDSLNVNSPVNATIKNVSINFGDASGANSNNQTNNNTITNTDGCSFSITVTVSYTIAMVFDENWNLIAYGFSVSVTMVIQMDCSGGGGGGYGGINPPPPPPGGGSNPPGGGPSGNGNNNWWNYGTGWPWSGGSTFDPNWWWWWTAGGYGGGGNPNAGFSSTVTSLGLQLGLTYTQSLWLEQNLEFALLIDQQLNENDFSEESKTTSKILIDLGINNLLETTWDVDFANTAMPHLQNHFSCCPGILGVPNFGLKWTTNTVANYVLLRQDNPGWSKLRCAWEAVQESVHTGLDVAGLIPVIGEVFDIANGVIYTIQGDGLNAALSYAGAVPFVGMAATAAKYFKKTITALDGTSRTLKWIKLTNNVIAFGDRGLLRKVLGLAKGDPRVAHHLIPWEHAVDDLVQKAAQAPNAFHLNELLNGLPLTALQHNSGGHALYNQKIKTKLTQLWNSNGQTAMTPQTAEALIRSLANDIKTWILAHPNESINNIIL